MERKVKRFYLLPGINSAVISSQVFNWIKLIDEKGINTDCISMSSSNLSKEEVERIENKIGGQFHQVKYFRYLVSDFHLFGVLLKFYFKTVFKYDRIIFQTRLPKIGIPLYLIGIFYKVKVIYEARGAITAERDHVTRNRTKKGLKFKFRNGFINFNEKLFIKASDRVICVSDTLKNYYIKKYKIPKPDKFYVFHGAADNSLFYLDTNLRNEVRKELKYEKEDIVVIYSGKLIKEWEIPDVVFNFMNNLMNYNENIKFLVLTPDLEIANQFCDSNYLRSKTIILKSKFQDVNKYLNAADLSLMLREDVVMNNVASPTKFSEYIISGIPCIMSNSVYDFAQLIQETGFGVVLEEYDRFNEEEYKQIIKTLEIDRKEISLYGQNNLSKEVLISKYYNFIKNV